MIYNNRSGYVALSSLLVVLVILVLIGTATTLISIDSGQAAVQVYKEGQAMDVVDTCVSEALLELNEQSTLPSTVTLPSGGCTVVEDSQLGSTWTFTVTSSDNQYPKSVQVVAERTSTITVTQWSEQ